MRGLPTVPEEITRPMLAGAFAALTPREGEVLLWVFRGRRDAGIAVLLGISARTVSGHVRATPRKFGVETRLAAAMEVVGAFRGRGPAPDEITLPMLAGAFPALTT